MKKLYGAIYHTEKGNGYNGEFLETMVLINATSFEQAEIIADEKMIEKEMNIDDLWILGRIDEITDKEKYIQSCKEYGFYNIFE